MSGNIIPVNFRPARAPTPAQLSLEQNTQLQQIARKLVIGPVLSIDDYRFLNECGLGKVPDAQLSVAISRKIAVPAEATNRAVKFRLLADPN